VVEVSGRTSTVVVGSTTVVEVDVVVVVLVVVVEVEVVVVVVGEVHGEKADSSTTLQSLLSSPICHQSMKHVPPPFS